ncbi:hypothetical protein POTOM_009562 [Populus tomentosa]|uniref:Protein-serine/threonine phosphatase n=1 Tax=Populus tomentosa TaxID=118781 RepID=A0A8X8AN09_POPTO|nr:hypothetical protein POTOM_009562 [Populus tomentosa]
MGRFKIASFSILFAILFINTIQSSYGLSDQSCMIDHDNGGAPAVYESQECTRWVLTNGSLQNQNLISCQFATFPGMLGISRRPFNAVAVFDGHGGRESSEMGSKLLLDYLHVFQEAIKNDHVSCSTADVVL